MLDVSINIERLIAHAPESLRTDPVALREFIDAAISAVRRAFAELEPGDAFVHTDAITVMPLAHPPARCESCGAPPSELGQINCAYCGNLLAVIRAAGSRE